MPSVTLPELKTSTVYATTFLYSLSSQSLYLTYGKTDPWANDSAPTIPSTSIDQINDVWKNMIGGKRVFGGDFSPVIRRINWTSGTTYTAYDNQVENLSNTNFYVVTDDFNVYKCLANNNSQSSTIKPTTISTHSIQKTSDGYAWKYMYTVSDSDQLRFVTDDYIPVRTLDQDMGTRQWRVQEEAKPGAIEVIKILNGGSNYSNAANLTVTVSGDGRNFYGYATTNIAGSIDNIVIINPGIDYTTAAVTITDKSTIPGKNVSTRAIISPSGGHGSDPIFELYCSNIMIDTKIKYDEEGIFPTTNDYRQVALISNPKLNPDNQTAQNVLNASNTLYKDVSFFPVILQAYTISCTYPGSGNYLEDEVVYQGLDLNTSTFSGRVVSWDAAMGQLLLINITGTPSISKQLIGSKSLTSRIIGNYIPSILKPYTGNMLYINNLKPIERSSDQIEDFKILVKF